MVGKVLAHYQILDKLGEGGMGVVYRALDTKLNRPAAIKFLSGTWPMLRPGGVSSRRPGWHRPLWYSDGSFILYAGAQLGRSIPLKAVTPDGRPYPLSELWVSRLEAPCRFVPGKRAVVLVQGQSLHKNFWMLDIDSGKLRQLTDLKAGLSVKDFDISPDGKRILFDRSRENSDIVLIDLPGR